MFVTTQARVSWVEAKPMMSLSLTLAVLLDVEADGADDVLSCGGCDDVDASEALVCGESLCAVVSLDGVGASDDVERRKRRGRRARRPRAAALDGGASGQDDGRQANVGTRTRVTFMTASW